MNTGTSTPSITKKQAERIFENEMTTREFWFVSEENDNFNILQNVLDIMYNVQEGNHYIAKYLQGQHYTRLAIYCQTCRKELASFDPFVMHDKGKPHKKALQVILMQEKSAQRMSEQVLFQDPLLPSNCFPEGSLENKLDQCTAAVVGLHFVYKERVRGDELYTCQLCASNKASKRMNEDETFSHVTSDFHTFKYVSVAYGCSRNATLMDLKIRVREVMEREGRVNFPFPLLGPNGENSRQPTNEVSKKDVPPCSNSSSSKSSLSSTSSNSSCPAPKRPKLSPEHASAEMDSEESQTDFELESIAHFVEQLRNCVEEEGAVRSLLKELRPGHHRIFSNVVKVLGRGLVGFFSHNRNEEFERMANKFVEMTVRL